MAEPLTQSLLEYDLETLRLVNEVNEENTENEADHVRKSAAAKEAKKLLEAGEERLRKILGERKAARGKPVQKTLFDQAQQSGIPLAEPLPATAQADPLENLWRDYPLDRLTNWGATENDISKLKEGVRKRDNPHQLHTVGGLADYTSNAGGDPAFERRLTDFKGIGSAGAGRIEEALTQFHGWYARGGREEFARDRGLVPAPGAEVTSDAGAGEHAGDPGEPGPADAGQPGGDPPAVTAEFRAAADVESDTVITVGGESDDATVPEGGPDEYALAGREDEE